MSAANQLPILMTVAEFLDWPTPDGSERWELVEGIPRAMNAPSDRHALIHAEAAWLIRSHLDAARPDCRMGIGSGLHPNDYNYRIPDLAVACGPAATDSGSLRAPVLVIEILSPSNATDTWRNVALITTIPSVQEILVLESEKIEAVVLRRAPTDSWPRLLLASGDAVTLESIGFSAPLAAFYRTV
ncbi:MAG TPA: Uma2 family endonuclease [Acetobacteraceae bacterium]|nr:Uma2 family endonuclease [Acetobacteraceae bacterium]